MSSDTSRPLRLSDLAFLVAACGLSIVLTRPVYNELIVRGSLSTTGVASDPWLFSLVVAEMWLPPLTLPFAVAILLSSLQRPRSDLSELAKQPGFVAVAVLCGFGALGGVLVLVKHLMDAPLLRWYPLPHWSAHLTNGAGGAIAACWLMLLLGRTWSPQPTWPDRFGRLFGLVWILSWALLYFRSIRLCISL